MPNFIIHAFIGVIFGLLLLSLIGLLPTSPIPLMITLFLLAASSLVPDLDHQMSIPTRITLFLMSLLVFFLLFSNIWAVSGNFAKNNLFLQIFLTLGSYALIVLLVEMLYYVIKPEHRGIVHSYFALAVFIILVFILSFNPYFAITAGIGYLSHLWADGLFFKII